MANVNSTRMRVVLVDDMTAPLLRMQEALNGFNSVLKGIGGSGTRGISSINGKVNELNASVQIASKGFTKMGASIGLVLTAYENFGRLATMLGSSFGQVFEYAKELQTNTVGVAGILASMADINGKQMQWNEALGVSKNIMKELKSQALQTAATSKDLMNTFRAILGPGMANGMKISEVLDFTKVGVNAVKSLGLNDVQLVQELRSILQGNIRDASSTLATALGITNQDIKNARTQVGGVYQFLMERMKGFKDSTIETTKTMAGQFEIAKEAIIVAGQEGSESILKSYSGAMEKINKMLLVSDGKHLIVNPKMVNYMKDIADILDGIISTSIDFATYIYDKFWMLGTYIATFTLLPKVLEKAGQAASFLANKFATIKEIVSNNVATRENTLSVLERYDKELLAMQTRNKLQKEYSTLLDEVNKLSNENGVVAQNMYNNLKKLGLSEEESLKRTIQYMNAIKKEQEDVASSMLRSVGAAQRLNDKLKDSTNFAKNFGNTIKKVCGVLSEMSGAISSLGFAMTMLSDEEDSNIRTTGEWLIKADIMISAIGSITTALKTACGWFSKFSRLRMIAMAGKGSVAASTALTVGGGTIAGLVGGGLGLGAYMLFGDNAPKNLQEFLDRYAKNPNSMENIIKGYGQEHNRGEESFDEKSYLDQIKNKYGNMDDSSAGKSKGNSKSPQDIANDYQSLVVNIRNTTSSLYENQSAFDKTMESAEKQMTAWQKKLDKLKESGLLSPEDYDNAKALMNNYFSDMFNKAQTEQEKQNLSYMQAMTEQARLTTELGRGGQAEEYKIVDETLQARKQYLEQLLQAEGITKERRIELEKDYANTVKAIRDNNMYDYKTAWKATLEELSQQQINYGDSIKSAFSSIETAGTNLLNSTESFGQRIKTFFSDIASSIMAEMSKLIMKALITNVLLKAFSGLFGGGKTLKMSTNSAQISGGLINPNSFASGGVASGWSIVGEEGPELVNFSHPGRVYTAQQTANALGNAGGSVNIKIDLRNESGQQLEAESTGSSFDGENYIVGVVLKAISSNKYGMRTTLKGLANT